MEGCFRNEVKEVSRQRKGGLAFGEDVLIQNGVLGFERGWSVGRFDCWTNGYLYSMEES